MAWYRFDVKANTKDAEDNLNNLSKLLDRVDQAISGIGSRNDESNDRKTLDLLNDFKKVESEFQNISNSLSKYEQSTGFKGKTDDIQNLRKELKSSSDMLSEVSQKINSLGSGGGGSLKQYAQDTERMNRSLGESAKVIKDLQRINSRTRRLGNQQDRIADKVESTHYMSLRDLGTYTRNKKEIQNLPREQNIVDSIFDTYQKKYDETRARINSGLNTDGKPMSSEDLNKAHNDLKDFSRVIKKARDTNSTIDSTISTNDSAKDIIGSSLRLLGNKAAPALMALDVASKAFSGFMKLEKQGEQVNKSTGEQALELGNVTGHQSDQVVRGRVQNLMWNNRLGYNTQQGLDYLALAEQSRALGSKDRSGARADSMVNALEYGGRSTGVTDATWRGVAGAAMQAGGILSDRDVQRLSETIAGENMRSGNSGNTEANAKIITSAIQQLSRSGTLNQNGIGTMAATTALMSRSDKLFSGERGGQVVSNINQGFINASEGKDNALLWLMVQSNPTKYGNPRGLLTAEETLSEGLSNTENIGVARNFVRRLGANGAQGQAAGAFFLQQHFGLKPKEADKISQQMLDGKYSDAEIQKEVQKQDKAGKNQTKKNLSSYQKSEQASYNTQQAQGEAIQSSAAGMTKWFRDVQNGFGSAFHNIGKGIGTLGSSFWSNSTGHDNFTPTKFHHNPSKGNPMQDGVNAYGGSKLKSSSVRPKASGGSGIFGTTKVHAATLSKKEQAKGDNRLTKDQTSSKTINQKQEAESKSKAFLNTRSEEKNLRTERNNIERREESLKQFAQLLKTEKDGTHGSSGKAGSVGKSSKDLIKGIDDKDKKDNKKKKGSAVDKAKSKKPTGSTKRTKTSTSKNKSKKSLTNNNKVIVNMPAGTGLPGTVGNSIGKQVTKKIDEWSRNIVKK